VVTVGIVGLGVVGGTVQRAFADADVPTQGYDPLLGIGAIEDLSSCPAVFLCVPTPSAPDGSHDVSVVFSSVGEIERRLADETVIAVKSTVPPGTCDRLAAMYPRLEFASVPEFLVATAPMETFTGPDRVVIGARSGKTAALLADLMSRVAPAAPAMVVRPIEAELVKLCSNAMLASRVAMANELAEVCRRFGVPWPKIQGAVGLDRRIGPSHLTVTSERGFGGACLPKDLDGLIASAAQALYDTPLLRAISEFNLAIRDEANSRLEPASAGDGSRPERDLASAP
jgi:UDPglucose 6-dehydrogenase